MLRIGCCIPGGSFMPQGVGSVENSFDVLKFGAKAVYDSGYDYLEATVGSIMALAPDEIDKLYGEGFKIEVCNSFIPPKYSIMNRSSGLEDYVAEATRRMNLLGCDTVVLGSGGARKIPDGMSMEDAESVFGEFLSTCNKYCEKYSITLVLEPLNYKECNFFNTVSRGAQLVKRYDLKNVKLLADAYHMSVEKEPLSTLCDVSDILCHVHVADPERRYPGYKDKDYIKAVAEALKCAGYNKRVTVECGFEDFKTEAALAERFLREIF